MQSKNPSTTPLLEFENITVVRGVPAKKVLDRVCLTIRQGENIALLGPNGAGKSSLIKTITREYYPLMRQDRVFRIWGKEQWDIFDLRFQLGIVTNDLQYTFTGDVTGRDAVLSGFFGSVGLYDASVTSKMKKKAADIIGFLELSHLQNKKMSVMSSGEARRFLIGRAMVHNPHALILDEPTNSLDLLGMHKFRAVVRKIARSGTSIILVTQNIPDIIPEITRVVLMKAGRVIHDGPKESLLTSRGVSSLFGARVRIKHHDGYYYALGD
jgi:iron complex transport system ATP-binding protein